MRIFPTHPICVSDPSVSRWFVPRIAMSHDAACAIRCMRGEHTLQTNDKDANSYVI
jgi:hypothetical protein